MAEELATVPRIAGSSPVQNKYLYSLQVPGLTVCLIYVRSNVSASKKFFIIRLYILAFCQLTWVRLPNYPDAVSLSVLEIERLPVLLW